MVQRLCLGTGLFLKHYPQLIVCFLHAPLLGKQHGSLITPVGFERFQGKHLAVGDDRLVRFTKSTQHHAPGMIVGPGTRSRLGVQQRQSILIQRPASPRVARVGIEVLDRPNDEVGIFRKQLHHQFLILQRGNHIEDGGEVSVGASEAASPKLRGLDQLAFRKQPKAARMGKIGVRGPERTARWRWTLGALRWGR